MKINIASWHYNLLYRQLTGQEHGPTTNICSYFWACIFMLFIGWPCKIIFYYGLARLCWGSILCSLNWFAGYTPRERYFEISSDAWYWDERPGYQVGEVKLYPYHVITPALLVALASFVSVHWWPIGFYLIMALVTTCLGGFLIFALASKARRTESWELIREFAAAKKAKICPLIIFEK